MKILWHSNAPWTKTGYGVQTSIACEKLKEAGYEVVISAFYGIDGATINAPGGFLVLPSHHDAFGNDIVGAHFEFSDADLLISLVDAWVMTAEVLKDIPWASWTPVDHYPCPDHVWKSLKEKDGIPIAMSRFGERALQEQGLDPFYVPHSIEEIFLGPVDRDEVRARYKWTDKFVVGMVAANKGHQPSRKSFAQVLEAFEQFHQKHPDALLYLHTEKDPPYGLNLPDMTQRFGIPDEAVLFVDPYKQLVGLGSDYMRDSFAAIDVLANPAMGEGFGVPIIEAQAVGTPVIVSDWTSMPELCRNGVIVGGTEYYTAQSSFQLMPDVGEIYDGMEWAYGRPRDEESRKWVADNYSPQHVFDKFWVPTLEGIKTRIEYEK